LFTSSSLFTAKCVTCIEDHSAQVTAVNFNIDGSKIVSSSFDGFCRIWDTASGRCLEILTNNNMAPIAFATFSPNSMFVLTSTLNSTLQMWDISRGKCIRTYTGHRNEKYCMFTNFSVTGGLWIVSGSEDHTVYIWNLQNRKIEQRLLLPHSNAVLATTCHPYANIIASASLDTIINFWHSPT
ncbi:WD repeat-containing protein 5, partial [Pseudolycoriella hygida]